MGRIQRSHAKRARDESSDGDHANRYLDKYSNKLALKGRRGGHRADRHTAEDSFDTSDDDDTAQHSMRTRSRNTAPSTPPVTRGRSRDELKRLATAGDVQAAAQLEKLREVGRNSQATIRKRAEAGVPSAVATVRKGNQRRHDLSALRVMQAKLKPSIDRGDENAAAVLAAQHEEYRRKYPRSTLTVITTPVTHDQHDELQQTSTADPPDDAFHITRNPTAENTAAESEGRHSFAHTVANHNVDRASREVAMDIAAQAADVTEPDNHQDEVSAPRIALARPHGLPFPTSRTLEFPRLHNSITMPLPTESNSSSATEESVSRNAIAGDDSDCEVIGSIQKPQATLGEVIHSIHQGLGSFRNDDEDIEEIKLQIERKKAAEQRQKAKEERLELELRLHRYQRKPRQVSQPSQTVQQQGRSSREDASASPSDVIGKIE